MKKSLVQPALNPFLYGTAGYPKTRVLGTRSATKGESRSKQTFKKSHCFLQLLMSAACLMHARLVIRPKNENLRMSSFYCWPKYLSRKKMQIAVLHTFFKIVLNWEITPLKFLLQYSIHKWGGKFKWIRKLWWLGAFLFILLFFYCYWYSFCLLSESMNWSIFPSFWKKTIQIAQRTKQRLKNSAERIKECGRLNIWF